MGDHKLLDPVEETHDGHDWVIVRTKKTENSSAVWEFWFDAENDGEFSGYYTITNEDGTGLRVGPWEPEKAPHQYKDDAQKKAEKLL